MLEVEILGGELVPEGPPAEEVRRLCGLAAGSAGIANGHLAIEYVDARRIAELNAIHRGKPAPTDVLSFPIDGVPVQDGALARDEGSAPGGTSARDGDRYGDVHDGVPHELGDVVICPEHTADLREAIVHGVLHLVGMDHETDDGEMLALQAQLLDWDRDGNGRGYGYDGDRYVGGERHVDGERCGDGERRGDGDWRGDGERREDGERCGDGDRHGDGERQGDGERCGGGERRGDGDRYVGGERRGGGERR